MRRCKTEEYQQYAWNLKKKNTSCDTERTCRLSELRGMNEPSDSFVTLNKTISALPINQCTRQNTLNAFKLKENRKEKWKQQEGRGPIDCMHVWTRSQITLLKSQKLSLSLSAAQSNGTAMRTTDSSLIVTITRPHRGDSHAARTI